MTSDVSTGDIADPAALVAKHIPSDVTGKFEIYSYRNAATVLAGSYPQQFNEILTALRSFKITTEMIRSPGGSKSQIAKYFDTLFDDGWQESRISADLKVRLLHAQQKSEVLAEYERTGFLDGHRIDFVKGKIALDLEWNSKDQTYDRDLYAFSAFYGAGAIDVGVIVTRGTSLDNDYFRGLGRVLRSDGTEGSDHVYKKYGASTTWMGKLLYRLDAGRNGGCPVLAVGITPDCVR